MEMKNSVGIELRCFGKKKLSGLCGACGWQYLCQVKYNEAAVDIVDLVNHPPHYTQYSFEVIEIIDEVTAHVSGQDGYMIGNVIKYILRAPFKGGLESLKKAKWYLDNLIERVENEGGTYGIK